MTIDELLRRRVADVQRERRLPSLLVGVAHGGAPVAMHYAGLADVLSRVPAASGTQYRIGSVTKTFTAAIVLLLAERHALDLDDRVEAYLPKTSVGRPTLR